jgi:uncharacterized protein (DUF433 family)
MAREIVRDPGILGGRWRFAGTTIAVADVRRLLGAGNPTEAQDTLALYAQAGLTAEELAAAQAFRFPNLREMTVAMPLSSVVVNCVCGEQSGQTAVGQGISIIPCPCGRTWRVTVAAELT